MAATTGKFLIRDAKTHERLGTTDDATERFGRKSRDDVYIDTYCDEDRAKLDQAIKEN
jgi:hypothetical protein